MLIKDLINLILVNMKQNKIWTEEEIEFLKQNLKKFGAIVCAEKLNRTVDSVIGKGHNLKIGCNKHPIDIISQEEIQNLQFNGKQTQHYNFTINFSQTKYPKELAYFIGFFWADGYVSNNGGIRIKITKEDGDKIFPIFLKLGEFKIYYQNRKGRKPQAEVFINRVDIADKFRDLGKYPKTIESHKKILDYIPKEYWNYFLRGYIDGDGCYYIQSKKNTYSTTFSITSAYNQDWSGMQECLKYFGLETKVIQRQTKTGCSSYIRNCNSHEIKAFVEKIYDKKDNIWLPRKYEKVQFFLNLN